MYSRGSHNKINQRRKELKIKAETDTLYDRIQELVSKSERLL